MPFSQRLSLFLSLIFGATVAWGRSAPDYLSAVKPLLASRCFDCHGALRQKDGLRLDTVAQMIEHEVIVAGKPDASELLHRISSTDPDEIMPPPHEGSPFTPDQIQIIREWIAAGAPHPENEKPEADPAKHWSFQPISRPALPAGEAPHPVDRFIFDHHQQTGLTPAPEASRLELIRRVYFDLIGLPPETGELAALMDDSGADWYEKLVNRLLEDPRHGERWARHWMEVWRYSDWWGLGDQLRHSQKHIWHWRDWIVESLNANLGYDEMLRLMLAADELYPEDLARLRASGLLARQFVLFNRNTWMDDTVEHLGKGLLGLTMNCAKCHNHKFDPFSQEDYYAMRAIFEPYLVRLELVPGEADFEKDGIPRAFDALPDAPTYLYHRGNEANPDKSRIIPPRVPKIIAFEPLGIEPVSLPVPAYQPARRPGVPETHLSRAEKNVTSAVTDLEKAEATLLAARNRLSPVTQTRLSVHQPELVPAGTFVDTFETLDPARWAMIGGEWVHGTGSIEQKKDGPVRSRLRHLGATPLDFDATVRFLITGGSNYRSVGLAFDAGPESEGPSEQLLYLSVGGAKVQAAYQENGNWKYPGGGAMHSRPLLENEEYTLHLQVRDNLINASLNGQPVISWRTPLPRRAGSLDLITFDAPAVFYDFSIAPLDPKLSLRESSEKNTTPESTAQTVAEAEDKKAMAEAGVSVARAELESVRLRASAMQAPGDRSAAEAAIKAGRALDLAKSRRNLIEAGQKLKKTAADKKEAATKEVEKARQTVTRAEANLAAAVEEKEIYAPLEGALWSPTRFASSGRDDRAPDFPPTSTGRRSALARWITDQRNPLTARVAVNHIWLRHMGQAIVPSVFDFGRNGTPPTHPELLDWLAAELMEKNWDMKHLHRLILNSRAYRMSSSRADLANREKDPDNHGFWHRPMIRLESQAVRDSILAHAGELDLTRGGPPVPPNQQDTSKRRSLYFFHSNNDRHLFLTQFDDARVAECYQREQSVVPQQALALANSRLVLEAAPKIAARLSDPNSQTGVSVSRGAGENDDVVFVKKAFATLLAITPGEVEISASLRALEDFRKLPGTTPAAARTQLIWALLNHNDFVTLR